MRVGVVLSCLFVAACSMLLLNGQTFSNALIALAAVLVALGVCLASAWGVRFPVADKRRWGVAALFAGFLAVVLLAKLPGAYSTQKRWNESQRKVRETFAVKVIRKS